MLHNYNSPCKLNYTQHYNSSQRSDVSVCFSRTMVSPEQSVAYSSTLKTDNLLLSEDHSAKYIHGKCDLFKTRHLEDDKITKSSLLLRIHLKRS